MMTVMTVLKTTLNLSYVYILQAGTVLGQAQLKLELELNFTSLKICCIILIKLVKLRKLGGATLFILQNLLRNGQHIL